MACIIGTYKEEERQIDDIGIAIELRVCLMRETKA